VKVAIIGAAGYVGGYLVDELNRQGITPAVITRSNGALLMFGKRVHAAEPGQTFDVVINLAFPAGKAHQMRDDNRAIIDRIEALGGDVVIHASSLAVFGYSLEHTVTKQRVAVRADWPYVESKIDFEGQLLDRFGDREVHVVRLGNVWGPGSNNWTVPIMNNVLYRQPTAIRNHDGFSNATDVANVASYLAFLAQRRTRRGAHFHHLAELSELRWSAFHRHFSEVFQQPIEYLETAPSSSEGLIRSVRSSPQLKAIYNSPRVGSLLRRTVGRLPKRGARSLLRIRVFSPPRDPAADTTFFRVMACPRQFPNDVDLAWRPPLNFDQSWNAVRTWIDRIELAY
jgi:nucleoside-diphosphate-sugar epimerase